MTFCAACKRDITQVEIEKSCCLSARLYGMLLFCKAFARSQILFANEHEFVADHFVVLLRELGVSDSVIKRYHKTRDHCVEITDRMTIERIYADYGYSGDELNLRIKTGNLVCDACVGAFISGCFLSGGTITDPQKGYHLEFTTYRTNLLNDLFRLLDESGFEPRITSRGFGKMIYYKNSGTIEDLLTYMGAIESSLTIMQTKVEKDVKNRINRQMNCESANLDKAIDASAKDRAAIAFIIEKKGEEWLSGDLLEIAKLRMDYPDLSMTDLGNMLEKKLTKSGVSHRLRRIRETAEMLRKGEEDADQTE